MAYIPLSFLSAPQWFVLVWRSSATTAEDKCRARHASSFGPRDGECEIFVVLRQPRDADPKYVHCCHVRSQQGYSFSADTPVRIIPYAIICEGLRDLCMGAVAANAAA